MTLRVGIDVGGTHTDAVLLEGNAVIAATKARTTEDIESGVVTALETVLAESGRSRADVAGVMIGTTQFTNAIIERRELTETAVVRIALPSGRGVPPKLDWPRDIAAALGDHVYMLHGGRRFDGKPLADPVDAEIAATINDIERKGLRSVSVASAYAPLDPQPELDFAARLNDRLPDVQVVMSHTIGSHGILERENAAALNAALLPFADRVIRSFERALADRGLDCPMFISQNDGTLMTTAVARIFPALTFSSGPTNSLRGASTLTGLSEAVVVDIGGTTSDVGVLRSRFPRESNLGVEVGGVRTNFRMPDIVAIGLGGGSLVSSDGRAIGPQSVGYRLQEEGIAFGGSTLTATDIVVAGGGAELGARSRLSGISREVIERASRRMHDMIDATIDRMRTSRQPVPVILVGGGAILVTGDLPSAAEIFRPDHAGVANAIGAGNAEVGGEAELLATARSLSREEAIEEATREASARALAAGAIESTLRRVDVEETQLSYMAEATARIRVRVVGQLDLGGGDD